MITRLFIFLFTVELISCKAATKKEESPANEPVISAVTIVSPVEDTMSEIIELNATSAYLQKSYVKASANGYISSASTKIGSFVTDGQLLFVLKTKEGQSIGNTINVLDTSFRFSGLINIKSRTNGYLEEVNHQVGDYVQEGEQLAVINDQESFVFVLNLPYELRPYVLQQKKVALLLPDGRSFSGNVVSSMPLLDSASQTQNILVKVNEKDLPANLIAKVRVGKKLSAQAISLPKQAVLSDETQGAFWVMKVIDSTTAIKIPVTKGIETKDRIEILKPLFDTNDKFLLTGNFGLADTAKIRIIAK